MMTAKMVGWDDRQMKMVTAGDHRMWEEGGASQRNTSLGVGRVVGGEDDPRSLPCAWHATCFHLHVHLSSQTLPPLLARRNVIRCLGPKLGPVGLVPRLHAVLRLKYIYRHGRSLEARWRLGVTGRARMEGRREGDSESWIMYLELKINTSLHMIDTVHTIQGQTLTYRSRFLAIMTLAAGPQPLKIWPWYMRNFDTTFDLKSRENRYPITSKLWR